MTDRQQGTEQEPWLGICARCGTRRVLRHVCGCGVLVPDPEPGDSGETDDPARFGVRRGDWEGTVIEGVIRDVVFSDDQQMYIVLLEPQGHAFVAPQYVHLFGRIGDAIGQRWRIVLAENGHIWCHDVLASTGDEEGEDIMSTILSLEESASEEPDDEVLVPTWLLWDASAALRQLVGALEEIADETTDASSKQVALRAIEKKSSIGQPEKEG